MGGVGKWEEGVGGWSWVLAGKVECRRMCWWGVVVVVIGWGWMHASCWWGVGNCVNILASGELVYVGMGGWVLHASGCW